MSVSLSRTETGVFSSIVSRCFRWNLLIYVYLCSVFFILKNDEKIKIVKTLKHDKNKQDAQLSQRDRAAGCISFGQKWKTAIGRQYFTNTIGLSSTTVI